MKYNPLYATGIKSDLKTYKKYLIFVLVKSIYMNKLFKINLIGVILFLTSCSTSMSPMQVNNVLPTLTKSKYISQSEIETSKCKYLTKSRSYVAPIGISAKDDLRNGAQGIDEWVTLDGGNAYILKNFKWVYVSNDATQLHLEFDTLLCE
jgi:hypothetical protein